MFEEVEVPSVFDGFADALANIWQVFRDAWKSKGQSVVDAAQRAFAALKQTALDIGAAFYNVWTEGTGQAFVESILGGVRSLLDLVAAFAAAFDEAWTSAGRGEGLIRAILTMMTEVVNTVTAIGDSFAAVWNNGTGAAVWANILEIITNVNTVIGNLAANFRKAWEDDGAGKRIWQALLNMANNVLAAINQITGATADWAGKLNFGPLVHALGVLLDALEPLVALICEGLAWAWENVLLPFGTWTIETAAPALLEALSAGFEVLTAVLRVLQPVGLAIWDSFLQPLASFVWDAISGALQVITNSLQKLTDLLSGNTTFSEFVDSLAPGEAIILGIAAALTTFATVSGIVTAVGTALLGVVTALSAAFGLLTSPLGLIVAAIAAVAAGFVLLYQKCEPFREWVDGIITAAGELIPGIIQGISDAWSGFIGWLSGLWDSIVQGFKDFFGIHSPSTVMADQGNFLIEGLLNGISGAWTGITSFFSAALEGLGATLSRAWESIKATASTTWNNLKSTVTNAFEGTKNGIISIAGGIQSGLSSAWEFTKSAASTAWSSIKSTVTSVFESTKSGVITTAENLKSGLSTAWNNVKSTASTKWTNISSTVKTLWTDLKTDVGKVDWTSIGSKEPLI